MSATSLGLARGRWSVRGGELADPQRLEPADRERAQHFLERLPVESVSKTFLPSVGLGTAASGTLIEIARYLNLPEQLRADAYAVVRGIELALRGGRLVLLQTRRIVWERTQEASAPASAAANDAADELGTFVLQYEVEDLATWFDTRVTLSADDGSYSTVWHLVAAHDGAHPPSRFVFTRMPMKTTYSLCLEETTGPETAAPARYLFRGVSYDDLVTAEWQHQLLASET